MCFFITKKVLPTIQYMLKCVYMRKTIIAQFYKELRGKKKGEEEEQERRTSTVYVTRYSNIYHI